MARRALTLLAAVAGLLAALGLTEVGLRALRGGAHAHLALYVEGDPPTARPGTRVVGLLRTHRYVVEIDADGLRAPSAPTGTVLLGDSLAFGLGLAGEDTLAARCTARGHPMRNAALPSYAVADALARGESLAPTATEFMIVLNPADDDAAPLATHVRVENGWLLRRDSPEWLAAFFRSSWSGWQLPHALARIAALALPAPLPSEGWPAVGQRLRAFIERHPRTRVVWGGYPSETLPDGRRVEALRKELGVATVAIELRDAWLAGDFHWSATGVTQVAAQVCP